MRIFHCDHCSNPAFFENTLCGRCGRQLAYLPDLGVVASLDPVEPSKDAPADAPKRWTSPVPRAKGKTYRVCENDVKHQLCNWAILADDPNPLCRACRLTSVIPDLSVPGNVDLWRKVETAKRRLVYSLIELGLPLRDRTEDPERGLTFRFMSDPVGGPRVLTGHDGGVITLNIAEADDVERERMRVSMHEPYRTLLGHFRHEVGHYYWDELVKNSERLNEFRTTFGDESADYDAALLEHYQKGPRPDWREHFVSAYASVHPWEDWAETWAHYLHMTDTLETAATCGLSLQPERTEDPTMGKPEVKPVQHQSFDEIINNWFPLTYALNNLNRGMGLADAYPFVLPTPAIEKLRFVHDTICMGEREGPVTDNKPEPVGVG
jgi:hypothetical protein